MVDFKYLHLGICGLANAHPLGTMAGHLGAAVAAGYFLGEDNHDLPEGVVAGIESELERIIAGEEAIWYDVKKTGVKPTELFRDLPTAESTPETIPLIANALQENVGQLRQSGHNVIFASIGIRALQGHHDFATTAAIKGIEKLIKRFNGVHPGRGYYGKAKGWLNGNQVKLVEDQVFPQYESIQQMVDTTVGELITTAAIKKQGFGGLWHIINHAAAITELDRLGFRELAQLALPAHHHHIRLWRSLPDVEAELGPVVKATEEPLASEYWQGQLKRDGAQLTHRIKTLFGYRTIRQTVEDPQRQKLADDAFLYLMK